MSYVFSSGTYNTSELVLKWEPKDPVIINKDLHLTEYKLIKTWENSSVVSYENSDFEEDEVEEVEEEEEREDLTNSFAHYGKFCMFL